MALLRIGNFAIEWSLVYAARLTARDFREVIPQRVILFADIPGTAAGEPTAVLDYEDSQTVWHRIQADKRFTTFGTERPIAIDMSKVLMVAKLPEGQEAEVTIRLSNEGTETLKLDHSTLYLILQSLTPSLPA